MGQHTKFSFKRFALKALSVLLALVFFLVALGVLGTVATGSIDGSVGTMIQRLPLLGPILSSYTHPEAPANQGESDKPKVKSFSEYSWQELSKISQEIAQAESDEAGRALAASYGLIDANGKLTREKRRIELSDGVVAEVALAGIRVDPSSANKKPAGLSFMTLDALAQQPMGENTIVGGWRDSKLRGWLNQDLLAKFPQELQQLIIPVDKKTNNEGAANDPSAVSVSSDKLWLFSAAEVCGNIDWYEHEYGGNFKSFDHILQAEGQQYEAFAEAGVTSRSDPSGALVRAYMGTPVSWWYRTPFSLVWNVSSEVYFHAVLQSGYPYGFFAPTEAKGIVVGFCL